MGEQDDVAALCANIAGAAMGHGDVEAAIADLYRLPPDLRARGRLAAGLLEKVTWSDPMSDPRRLRVLDGLLEIAEGPRPVTPQWTRTVTAARVLSMVRAVAEREVNDLAAAERRIEELAGEAGTDPALLPLIGAARASVRLARSVQQDDAGAMARFPEEMLSFVDGFPAGDPRVDAIRGWLTVAAEVVAVNSRGGDIAASLRDLRRAAELLPPGDMRDMSDRFTSMLSAGLGAGAGGAPVTDEQLAELRAQTEQPGLGDPDRALQHTGVAAAALGMGQETDPARVDEGIAQLRRALELTGPDDPLRVFHLCGLALGLMRRAELTNATADLREARTLLEQARTLAGGPAHPQWAMLGEMLADVQRLLGDDRDFHRAALEGLRGHVWKVLVQPDLAGSTAAVQTAGTDAVETARRCLVAGDPAGAIGALDAGRGLALFAATEVGSIADHLDRAGDADLAKRWRTAAASHDPARLPADLRRAVMTVLSAHSSAAGLLDPPGPAEIGQALAAIDADALVYLLPGAGSIPGYAVAVAVTGRPSYLALPNLATQGDRDVERYLVALSVRDMGALATRGTGPGGAQPRDIDAQDTELSDSLGAMCDWAWRAAMGPLIESYLPQLPVPASGRPPRVVLVPMGDLARIPWQAARRQDGRYAVELIAISQAASARMLCHSAALSPVVLSPVGMLVGDPDTTDPKGRCARDLDAARLEAFAIRHSFYRGARYVGRRPDGSVSPSGPGTPDQVRDWLAAPGPAAGAMLHLACHGFVRAGTDRPTAYLLLAGGQKLTAEELIALMARTPDRDVGLVVLAACRTGLSINGYDEAYSLGTAFLAGGARTVLSTQWGIPDSDTSALMYMFHRFLRRDGLPPWAALRAAQRWMLDRDRDIPKEMPRPLSDQIGPELHAVIAWAAFVHWGQ